MHALAKQQQQMHCIHVAATSCHDQRMLMHSLCPCRPSLVREESPDVFVRLAEGIGAGYFVQSTGQTEVFSNHIT